MSRTARRRLVLLVCFAAVLAVAAAGFWYARQASAQGAQAADPAPRPSTPAAPTAAGATSGAARGAALPTAVVEPTEDQPVATDPPLETAGRSIAVVVTNAAWDAPAGVSAEDSKTGSVEVNGFVSGVVESGGTCQATLTLNGVTVTGQVRGQADATTTVCPEIVLSDPRLTPGTWKLVLSYRSATSSGSAAPVDVQVTPR